MSVCVSFAATGRLPVAWDTYQATVEDYQSQNIDHMSRLYTVEKSRLYIVCKNSKRTPVTLVRLSQKWPAW